MNNNRPKFDLFISYSSHDKSWVRALFAALVDRGYEVFFDEECIRPGDNIWLAISDALDSSRYLVFVLSQWGLASDWAQMEVIAQRWRDPLNRERSIIPILLNDCTLPKLLRPIKYIDARGDRLLQDIVKEIEFSISSRAIETPETEPTLPQGQGATRALDRVSQIRESLRLRLKFDLFVTGPMRGQFGAAGGRSADRYYQSPGGESPKVKPAYYLTYWGWRVAFRLSPEMVASHSVITADSIRTRFAGKRWVEVTLRDYEGSPASIARHVATVRHTVRAAEILLLLGHNLDKVSQVAWDVLQQAPMLMNPDGGWKEFLQGEQRSSLFSSLSVFRFLAQLTQLDERAGLLGEPEHFAAEVAPLLERTEEYLLSQWHHRKWQFRELSWEVNAPTTFIGYAPFSSKPNAIAQIYETLRELLVPSGRLINPTVGSKFGCPEYSLSVRLAYALQCTAALSQHDDLRRTALKRWLLDSYSDSERLDTCDIAFLAEILSNSDG